MVKNNYLGSNQKKITAPYLLEMKKNGDKISVLTAYDALMAQIIDEAGCDVILVGDSAGMVMGGKENTISVTMDEMILYTSSVKRGVKHALLVADMPFLSYQVNIELAIKNAGRFLKEAGAEAVKIEGGEPMLKTISTMVNIGIPVMGHIGLTPQSINVFGGYKTQGTEKDKASILVEEAKMLEEAGVFSIVLEKIPSKLGKEISQAIDIPTIGIGAGADCDGQVLVTQDMLGMFKKFKPKFARRYLELGNVIEEACRSYISDVKSSNFPSADESY